MTRRLYEVAVITESTRNRDVKWTIEPICTAANCRIHPALSNTISSFSFEDSSESVCRLETNPDTVSEPNSGGSREFSMPSDFCPSTQFEVGHSVSSFTTDGILSTGVTDFSESSWLKQAFIAQELPPGKYEDLFESNKTKTGSKRDVDLQTDLVNILSEKDNKADGEIISYQGEKQTPISFRDALLGLGRCENSEDNSSAKSELSNDSDVFLSESLTNSSMSLSVTETEESGSDSRSGIVIEMEQIVGYEVNRPSAIDPGSDEAPYVPDALTHPRGFLSSAETSDQENIRPVESASNENKNETPNDSEKESGSAVSESSSKGRSKGGSSRKKVILKPNCTTTQNVNKVRSSLQEIVNNEANVTYKNVFTVAGGSVETAVVPQIHEEIRSTQEPQEFYVEYPHLQDISGRIQSDSGMGTMVGTPDASKRTFASIVKNNSVQSDETGIDIAQVSSERFMTSPVMCKTPSEWRSKQRCENINKRIVLKNPPYKCNVPHSQHFKPVREFNSILNEQSDIEPDAILAFSQRVVRLTVRKPYIPVDNDLAREYRRLNTFTHNTGEQTLTDNYGTGFVYEITDDELKIRTHSRLVSSIEEARNTLVQVNIQDSICRGEITIEFTSNAILFHKNEYSQTSIFSCPLPGDLRSFAHVFKPIPESFRKYPGYNHDSLSDSKFTDCDDRSFFGLPFTVQQLEDHLRGVSKIWETEERTESSELSPETSEHTTESASLVCLEEPDPVWTAPKFPKRDTSGRVHIERLFSPSPNASRQPVQDPTSVMTLGLSGFRENTPIPAADENVNENTNVANRQQTYLGNGNVPMRNSTGSESHAEYIDALFDNSRSSNAYRTTTDSDGYYDIPGISNVFRPFKSYMADIVYDSYVKPAYELNASAFTDRQEYDYASLIYVQMTCPDAYREAFKPKPLQDFDDHKNEHGCEIRRRLFSHQGNQTDELDCDLLGIDPNWKRIQEADYEMESIVASILSDDSEDTSARLRRVDPEPELAIVISHPHGGQKMVSVGDFTGKHIGGELHSAPTCLGSCGAPIISSCKAGLFLTDLVHGGTTTVGNRVEKFGLCHFQDVLMSEY